MQFHPSYSYSDFVECLKPVSNGSNVTYALEDGALKVFAKQAEALPDQWHVLIIDEMNRGTYQQYLVSCCICWSTDHRKQLPSQFPSSNSSCQTTCSSLEQ